MNTLIVAEVEFDAEGFTPGDYVLATKYNDGDPGDHYCTGFYVGSFRDRHLVADSNGRLYRYNGFRRIEKVTPEEGTWMVEHFKDFKFFENGVDEFGEEVGPIGWSVWDWLAHYRHSSIATQ